MDKFNKYVLVCAKWLFPVAVLTAILGTVFKISDDGIIFNILGVLTVTWIISIIYIAFALAISSRLRESFVKRWAGIRENDERESQIAGQVSKKTFIFMMGILPLMLLLSALEVRIYNYKTPPAVGQNGSINIGFGLSFMKSGEEKIQEKNLATDEDNRSYIVNYKGLPFSSDGMLILMIALQMGAFYFFSKKEQQQFE